MIHCPYIILEFGSMKCLRLTQPVPCVGLEGHNTMFPVVKSESSRRENSIDSIATCCWVFLDPIRGIVATISRSLEASSERFRVR